MTTALRTGAGAGRQATWTRDKIIERIRRWVDLYGEPPRAADWNPSSAKWSASTWRIERYRAGDPETGAAWPSLNAAKKLFPNPETGNPSFSEAIRAAGFEPNRPGPQRREDVRPEVVERLPVPAGVRVALEAAEARARDAEARMGVLERKVARVESARDRFREERDIARRARRPKATVKTKTKTKTVVREDARAKRRADRLERELADVKGQLGEARTDVAAARRDATRLAAKLERAEADKTALRAERRDLKRDRERAEDRATALERVNGTLRREASATPEPEVEVREVVKREVVRLPAPEAEVVDAARAEASRAERRALEAEQRAATAEREYRELAVAVTGEPRKLTASEMDELRKGGPSGPAVFAQAVRGLAAARKEGGVAPLRRALGEVASAAIRWKDALR